ncbi:MAG: hypothetical protein AUH85_01875 [Chloroflexi bacterium 13_1_40CM_4_68_4]|nr:MAG: hypothetical protein AUH85_01875 [Chloroflexi bacterium 13_1_40CM_4_68_4]
MEEERRALDPTRKLLKVFGVKVTDYEAKTQALLERAERDGSQLESALAEAVELTADLDHWLAEITTHVLSRQRDVLERLSKLGKT